MTLARWFHDKTHRGMVAIVNQIERMWAAPGIDMAVKRIVSSCPSCWKFSDAKPKQEAGGQPWAYFPFQRLQIDYADMPPVSGLKHLLVIVDQLSGWVEAFPTRKADTVGVVKALLRENHSQIRNT